MTRRMAVMALAVALTGCGSTPTPKADPVDVAGTFTLADGKPVRNVTVQFIPLSAGGLQGGYSLKADGKFRTTLVPAKYGYYFEGTPAAMKAIPAAYHSVSEAHTFEVPPAGAGELAVKLDGK